MIKTVSWNLTLNLKQNIIYLLIIALGASCGGQDKKEAAEFFGRGVFHFKKNELDDALRFFKEATLKDPELADAHNNIGLIYEIRGKYEAAADEFAKAILIDPTFSQAKFNHARLLSYLGNVDEALQIFFEIEQEYKDSVNYYIERGQTFVAKQQIESGIGDFELALNLEGNNSKALTNLGYAQIQLYNFSAAEEKLLKAIEKDSQEATAFNNLAFLYGITNDKENALTFAQKAVEIEPLNKVYRNNFAYSLLINNELEKAETELAELKKTLDRNPYFLRNLGVLNYKQGNYDIAEIQLAKAENIDPGTFLIYYYLGKNCLAKNQPEAAQKYFLLGARLSDGLCADALKELSDVE